MDKARKILWNTFFTFSFDFSMSITLRGLVSFVVLILMFSDDHACEPYVVEFDKLLHALAASEWRAWVLKKRWSG